MFVTQGEQDVPNTETIITGNLVRDTVKIIFILRKPHKSFLNISQAQMWSAASEPKALYAKLYYLGFTIGFNIFFKWAKSTET